MSEDEAMRKMSKLINYLMSRQDSAPFREPVDWKNLELFDYPKIVKKPMDLGTVKRKLERGQYPNANDCASDIRLIWTNCKTYNADGSDFYLLAESISKRFEDRYKKIEAECKCPHCEYSILHECIPITVLILALYLVDDTGSGDGENKASPSPPKSGVSLDVKARFASNIFRLSGMELGHVLQVIDLKCPNALEDPNPSHAEKDTYDEAQVEINIDAIDPRTFSELDRYVKDKMLARTTGEALDEMDDSPKKLKR
jgi:hypothetical protein